ncbi:FG-GAP-like repeat-containing protein, partial [Haloferax profundi]|uniref:FG-GAP-like repeat-containing protein n=1 Tax=Haloferax profundi TaxID=1544718 RepID=UPI000B1C0F0A
MSDSHVYPSSIFVVLLTIALITAPITSVGIASALGDDGTTAQKSVLSSRPDTRENKHKVSLDRLRTLSTVSSQSVNRRQLRPQTTLTATTSTTDDFRLVWNLQLSSGSQTRPRTNLYAVDADGDGDDEIAVGDVYRRGPSKFGLVSSEGSWLWRHDGSGKNIGEAAADVDGDGDEEIIFRENDGGEWVRPYDLNGDYLWSRQVGDWPDHAAAVDYDDDGRAEVAGMTDYRGYFSLWDDDGTEVWDLHSGSRVENLYGLKNVTGDESPEFLTNVGSSTGDDNSGIQVIQQDGKTGSTVVWQYGPVERVRPAFAELDTDAQSEVLAPYRSGAVHAIDHDGSQLWTVETSLDTASTTVAHVVGNSTPDAILWENRTVVVVDGATQRVYEFTASSEVQRVTALTDGALGVATTDQVGVAVPGTGLVLSAPTDGRVVRDLEAADISGDGVPEFVVGYRGDVEVFEYDKTSLLSPTTVTERWSVDLNRGNTRIATADTDGDGYDEVLAGDYDSYGPSTAGVIENGQWVWNESFSGAVTPISTGDVTGDGKTEAIFKSKVSGNWIRPYTHNGDTHWSKTLSDWPDTVETGDYDHDGKTEVVGSSATQEYVTLWQDDGSTVVETQATGDRGEVLHGLADVDGDSTPEILSSEKTSSGSWSVGVQLMTVSNGNLNTEWSFAANTDVDSELAQLTPDQGPEILVAERSTGTVHAIDGDGSVIWNVSTAASNVRLSAFDVVGGATPDAVLWGEKSIYIVDGATQEVTEISTGDTITGVSDYGSTGLVYSNDSSFTIVTPDNQQIAQQHVGASIVRLHTANEAGNQRPEVIVGTASNITSYAVSGQQAPARELRIAHSPEDPVTNRSVLFRSSVADSEHVESSTWTFGDGQSATGAQVAHRYTAAGSYTVTHTVVTTDGTTLATERDIRVHQRDISGYEILSVQPSTQGTSLSDVRLIEGTDINITYTVEVTNSSETTAVRFEYGEETTTDTDGSDGWTTTINAANLTADQTLLVKATHSNGTTTQEAAQLNVVDAPPWLEQFTLRDVLPNRGVVVYEH